MSLSLSWTCQRDKASFLVKYGLNKNNFFFKMIIMSLSLSWTYQRDRVSLFVKFVLNKNNFIYKKK